MLRTCRLAHLYVCIFVCCVTFAAREWALLSFHCVCLSVGHSATYSLPRLIDHNQIWSASIYLSSEPCKLFWSPVSHTLGARWKNMQNFAYFQRVFLPLRTWRIVPYDLSVCLSVHKVYYGKTADWIRMPMPFGVVCGVGLGMGVF